MSDIGKQDAQREKKGRSMPKVERATSTEPVSLPLPRLHTTISFPSFQGHQSSHQQQEAALEYQLPWPYVRA